MLSSTIRSLRPVTMQTSRISSHVLSNFNALKVNQTTLRSFSSTVEQDFAVEIKDIEKEYENRLLRRQAKTGTVVSTKSAKTISVEIEYMKYFPKYTTSIRRTRKIAAHDEEQQAKQGDVVRIVPCRPMSATKRHKLIDIIRRPKQAIDIDSLKKLQKEQAKAQALAAAK